MKNKKGIIALIILLSIVLIIISIFFVALLQNGFHLKNFKLGLQSSNELILDKDYSEIFSNIVVDATISEISLKRGNIDNIKVTIYGEKERTKVTTTQDTLTIKTQNKSCIGFCFNQKSAKVEVYLPENYSGNINIKNDYGDIFIDKFFQANMDIQEDCGDVKILGGNNIKVDNNYGDIEIKEANISNIKEDCGDVTISHINDVTIKNSYGDIKINTVNNYLNLQNDCGDITVDNVNLRKNSHIKDEYGDIKVGNTNEIYIDAKTDLGDIEINNNYNKADIILKIENDCGDINVNN